jgi:hypothetical protein
LIHLGAGRYLAEHIPRCQVRGLPGDDHLFYVGDTDALVDEIEEFLTGTRSGAEGDVLAAVLLTDVVGSARRATSWLVRTRPGHQTVASLTTVARLWEHSRRAT